ncbi:MAG: hypothetical protein K0Q90_2584 [Paenibacillaceae bacterium]|nr:hypothetical protein [Paenibacillaceae bacterium]
MKMPYAGDAAQVRTAISRVANRYIGENPPHPFVFRTFRRDGILATEEFNCNFNFNERFPEAEDGDVVYACSRVWSDSETSAVIHLNPSCPTVLFINGKEVHRTSYEVEIIQSRYAEWTIRLEKGWTHITLQFTKRSSGFGGEFGPPWAKWSYMLFLCPGVERSGQMGWIYTGLLKERLRPDQLPHEGWSETDCKVKWHPRREWTGPEREQGQLSRLFGIKPGFSAVGWAKMAFCGKGLGEYILTGSSFGAIRVLLDGKPVYCSESGGKFEVPLQVPFGIGNVIVVNYCGEKDWGFELEIRHHGKKMEWLQGVAVLGSPDSWLYAGSFPAEYSPEDSIAEAGMNNLLGDPLEPAYWRVDAPEAWVRPSLENDRYGKWNYPLGVTLYGLLKTGHLLGRPDISGYARGHLELCTSYYDYTLWDKKQYGLPGINHQLSHIDTLDDCGSFGAAMLEAQLEDRLEGAVAAADTIAAYISQRQSRLPDGALYRKSPLSATLWADDLYMSVPFLCRYYRLTGDQRYINDAAKQFLLYRTYLEIPELGVMSHVYNVSFGVRTGIPWGRGNGWVLFSLSELLEVLPPDHEDRNRLLDFYGHYARCILKLQGINGLWRQVLTDPESYEETSCSAMFVYALARGLRLGWLKLTDQLFKEVLSGWSGIERFGIDKQGNVHGVCRGSWYSFDHDYYKTGLLPLLNDTHGIGIVMLAGVEIVQLLEWMQDGGRVQ